MTVPLVSVVTTCRNALPHLRECVQSVHAQDWPNVEHIIQDAASDDGTRDFLARLGGSGPDWRSEPDGGEYEGLNRALARVRGDILIVLNGDDALLPHACGWAVEQFRRHPEAAVIYGDEIIVDGSGSPVMEYVAPDYSFEKLLRFEVVPPAQAAFIRCDRFREVGFHADESMKDCGDFEMWVRLGRRFPFVHVRESVTRYRWHDNKSRRPDEVARHAAAKSAVLDLFFADPAVRGEYGHLEAGARAGLLLWASESCFNMDAHDMARDYLRQALLHGPDPAHFAKYFRKTLNRRPDFADLLHAAPPGLLETVTDLHPLS